MASLSSTSSTRTGRGVAGAEALAALGDCVSSGICESVNGSRTVNVAPRPSPSLAAVIVPECRAMMDWAMVRPSPSPLAARLSVPPCQ